MRVRLALPFAAVLLVPGYAAAAEPSGLVCGVIAMRDPLAADGFLGEVDAGPVVLDSDDPAVRGSVTCTIRDKWDGRFLAAATSPVGTGVAYLPPTAVSGPAYSEDGFLLCTRVDLAGGATLYYDSPAEAWTTDPAAPCSPVPDDSSSACEFLWDCAEEMVDDVVCPVFATQFPPQGDIEGVWDCPPYGY